MAKEKRNKKREVEKQQQPRKVLQFNTQIEEEESEERKKNWWLFLIPIVICAVVVIVIFVLRNGRAYNDYEVVKRTESTDTTQMSYLAYNNSLIKYSKEGICYLDKNGTAIWVESYKMKQPTVVISDKYIAVADLNGNSVYIFNEDGKVDLIETPFTICNIDVASQGVFAVVLENETENFIELYDKYGEQLVEMRTTIADSGYPLDITLSPDGSKLISSYVTVEGVTVKNTIAAYNFGEVGQNETDRLVGGFSNLGDTIVPKVEFLNNDTICAFGDNQIIFYSMKEKPSEKSIINNLEGEIQSIFYNSKYIGIVEKCADGQDGLYQIRCFDSNGNQRFVKYIDFSYRNIYATETEIIIVGTSESRIYDFQGHLKFSHVFSKEVENIVPTGSEQRYIVVYDDATEVIKLQHTEEETEEVQ